MEIESYDRDPNVKIGDQIQIIQMSGEPRYSGRKGVVTEIDSANQIHGTWGGLALIYQIDRYEILK